MAQEGYVLCNAEEHEFQKTGTHIAFAPLENLTPLAGVEVAAIPHIRAGDTGYLLLTLADHLKVCRASSKDGCRKNVKNKQDTRKIALPEQALHSL